MLSLARSVITQATRGGRCVVPRRNFCSPPASQEAKGAGERIALAREANRAGLLDEPLVVGGYFLAGEIAQILSLQLQEAEAKMMLAESPPRD